MSKSIKKLKKAHNHYDLNVEGMSAAGGQIAVKAFLTIFTEEAKIIKKATAIATAADFESAQEKAIALVVDRVVV